MKMFLKKAYGILPWTIKDRIEYYRVFHELPNLRNPIKWSEKIISRKHNECFRYSKYSLFADKLQVREYIAKTIGTDYLIPLIIACDSVAELGLYLLQLHHCVVKPNHASGMVYFIDEPLSVNNALQLLNLASHWLATDYSKHKGEFHYQRIAKSILVEHNIGKSNSRLTDYKVHMFRQNDGGVFYVLQVIAHDKNNGALSGFYINNIDERYCGQASLDEHIYGLLPTLISLSEKLMGDLDYARVDWYIEEGRIYFGEITLTPCAGFCRGFSEELNLLMGSKWIMRAPEL